MPAEPSDALEPRLLLARPTSPRASARLHTGNILRLSTDLPVIVEVVEREERIQEALPELDRMIGGGLITLERARVIMYRPEKVSDEGVE